MGRELLLRPVYRGQPERVSRFAGKAPKQVVWLTIPGGPYPLPPAQRRKRLREARNCRQEVYHSGFARLSRTATSQGKQASAVTVASADASPTARRLQPRGALSQAYHSFHQCAGNFFRLTPSSSGDLCWRHENQPRCSSSCENPTYPALPGPGRDGRSCVLVGRVAGAAIRAHYRPAKRELVPPKREPC
jgi:hypothetical protein